MFVKKAVAIIALAVVASGCGGGTGYIKATVTTTDKFGQESIAFVQGEEITITLSLENISSETKTLTFPSSQHYDFAVKGQYGMEVWRWSEGQFFLPVLTSYTLAPSETKTFTYKWDQRLFRSSSIIPVGNYTLEADHLGIKATPQQDLKIL